MDSDWTRRVLALRHRYSRDEELEFVRLVDEAIGKGDEETVRTLLLTYSDEADHGVQESVNRVLFGHLPAQAVLEPFLDLLPQLQLQALRWVSILTGQLVKRAPRDFVSAVLARDDATRQRVLEVVSRPYFPQVYTNADAVRRALNVEAGPSTPPIGERDHGPSATQGSSLA